MNKSRLTFIRFSGGGVAHFFIISHLVVALLFTTSLYAMSAENVSLQQITVSGTVTDNGEPIPGVNVVVKGTTIGIATDINGQYSLTAPSRNAVLVFSYLGYITQEITIGNRTVIHVELVEDTQMIDEVVVIGYGTMRKRDLTGAVVSVSSDKLQAYPVQGAVQALQGRAAGIQVTSTNGDPGASLRVRVRGSTSLTASNDPLYVVDGFAGGMLPPPEDIISIDILKDASATAIYGSRGANGVILVTTKSGKSGRMKVEFNSSYSVDNVSKKIDMLNAREYGEFINELDTRAGVANPRFSDYASYGEGTNWQDLIFRTGYLQRHQVSISGGSDQIKSYTSLNFFDQDGIIINSNNKRFSGLSTIDYQIGKRLKASTNMNFQRNLRNNVRTQEGSGGIGSTGVIGGALTFEPTTPIYEDDGSYAISRVSDPIDNPYAMAKEYVGQETNDYFQGNGSAELLIIEGLTFKSTFGVQITNNRSGYYYPTTLNAGKSAPGGEAYISARKATQMQTSNYFTYNKSFNDVHRLNVMAGYEWQKSRSENWAMTNRTFPTDQFQFWNMGAGSDRRSNSSSLSEWVIASFIGRLNYNYSDRYLLTVTGRYDGSSRLGANSKWGFFPSAALAWNLHNEEFMQSVDFLSQFKLRAGYGETGNTDIGVYSSLANLTSQLVSINERQVNAVRPSTSNVPNADLRWESTNQTNIGLDMGFFKNRISITAEWYLKKSDGLLYSFPLPQYSGYSSATSNIGSIENRGFEFELRTVNFQSGDFQWGTDFNITFPTSKVTHLPLGEILSNRKPGHITDFTETHILREGLPVGSFYGYIFDGINPDDGTVRFKDIASRDANGNLVMTPDGVINPNDDRTVIGNPNPDYIVGFNNDFSYKNFDLNIFFNGVVGNDMYNFTRMELEWCNGKTNQMKTVLNRWSETNRNTDIPVASPVHSATSSSRWIEKGSYLRLQNVSIGYNLNMPSLKKMGIDRFRIYVSGQNLWLLTKYTGYDPEVSYNNNNTTFGGDYGSYPHRRSITFGLNLIF